MEPTKSDVSQQLIRVERADFTWYHRKLNIFHVGNTFGSVCAGLFGKSCDLVTWIGLWSLHLQKSYTSFKIVPTWSASQRHVMICYKSYPKPCPVRTPTARWWFRARQLCCRGGGSTPPTTNFYKKQSSKTSICGVPRSILLRKYFYHEKIDQWAAADAHLYWDPYCNGLWEMTCDFLVVFL